MSRRLKLLPVILLLMGWPGLAQTPVAFRLDTENGVGGLPFDAALNQLSGFTPRFSGFGKRWRMAHRYSYSRTTDTAQAHGVGRPTYYWFRQQRFEGVEIVLPDTAKLAPTLRQLTVLYGPAHPDTVPNSWYWLGRRSFVLLEKTYPRGSQVVLGSLRMLNEEVYETAVRARARRQLGWHPDSLGLPKQFPVR